MSLVVAMPLYVTKAKYSETTNVYKAMTWYHLCFIISFQVHTPGSLCCASHPDDNFIMNVADTLCEGHTDWIGATIPVGLWTIFCVIKYFPTTSAIDRGRGPGTERREVDKDGELYSSFHIMKGQSLLSFLISWMFDLKTFQIHSGIEPKSNSKD